MKRIEFYLNDEKFGKLMEACRPVPMIMLQCGDPGSPQENANRAWRSLGEG